MKTVRADAKINLFLRILRRGEDGFHDIETLFQRIDLADRLRFETTEQGFELQCSGSSEDLSGPDNMVARAYQAFVAHSGTPPHGVRIMLEKRIPTGGGLGGGSSDAASTLRVLAEIFAPHFDTEALHGIARRLGSDVPFFLGPPTAIGRGRGEILTALPAPPRLWVALAFPGFGISTAEVYARFDPSKPSATGDLDGLVRARADCDLARVLELLHNDMEALAFKIEPRLEGLRERLENSAGQIVRMSGSGTTLFTLSETENDTATIAERWESQGLVRAAVAAFVV